MWCKGDASRKGSLKTGSGSEDVRNAKSTEDPGSGSHGRHVRIKSTSRVLRCLITRKFVLLCCFVLDFTYVCSFAASPKRPLRGVALTNAVHTITVARQRPHERGVLHLPQPHYLIVVVHQKEPARNQPCLFLYKSSYSHPLLYFVFVLLCELLLDEERPQMRQLPCASPTKHQHLNERPLHHACVCRLGLIAELCFALL